MAYDRFTKIRMRLLLFQCNCLCPPQGWSVLTHPLFQSQRRTPTCEIAETMRPESNTSTRAFNTPGLDDIDMIGNRSEL